ncbi:hypothetical protein HJG60_009072 [Phyllostomus discolor]|uniref:Uncharacterized protein n=1 Tax=Phyllostomus discolor TaxID=89673 RepID=A0A833YF98_9CHIR|nr:hypothetical protein HJG60_009072 [Phyllostomus discolor]
MTPSSVTTSQDPFQPCGHHLPDPPQPLPSPPRIRDSQWCHHHFQDPLQPCSSPRTHHLESHAPQQLYSNCLLGSCGTHSCSLKGTQHNTHHFPIASKMEKGPPLMTLSPLRPFLMMSLPHSKLRLMPVSSPPQTWPWPAPLRPPW